MEMIRKNQEKFDQLISLYNQVRGFQSDHSYAVLKNFHTESKKFYLTINEPDSERLHLSSQAICTYALSQYLSSWDSKNDASDGKTFSDVLDYYKNIIRYLNQCIEKTQNISGSRQEHIDEYLIDEFTILNTLYLMIKIQDAAGIRDMPGTKKHPTIIQELINTICELYLFDPRYSIEDNRHPYIFYKFLYVLDYWSEKGWFSKKSIFDYAFDHFYKISKREMYRQMALYAADDRTLFDTKRLIYSYLVVMMRNTYTNNKIKDKVLDIIFKEQQGTGLWQIGHVIKPVYNIETIVKKMQESVDKHGAPMSVITVSSSPILSSIECLNDMLEHKYVKQGLYKYAENIRDTYNWVTRLKKAETHDKDEGWIPEYDDSHMAKSWMAGHCLIFLRRYEELLAKLINNQACADLNVIQYKYLENVKTISQLRDSYGYKTYIELFINGIKNKNVSGIDWEYQSILLYGPAGAGKSNIAKTMAKECEYHYLEIHPGIFLENGKANSAEKITDIFKRLNVLKKTVIFFNDIEHLVEEPQQSQASDWVATSFIPAIQGLRKNKNIIFVLATDDITKIDMDLIRRGKIDFVLPVGAVCWKDRLKILVDRIGTNKGLQKEILEEKSYDELVIELNDWQKSDPGAANQTANGKLKYVKRFLLKTNFIVGSEIQYEILKIFQKSREQPVSIEDLQKQKLFKTFFENDDQKYVGYESSNYKSFHNWYSLNYMKVPPYIGTMNDTDISVLDVLNNNIFMLPLFTLKDLRSGDERVKLIGDLIRNIHGSKNSESLVNYRYIYNQLSDPMKDMLSDHKFVSIDRDIFGLGILCEFNQMIMSSSLKSKIGLKNMEKTYPVTRNGGAESGQAVSSTVDSIIDHYLDNYQLLDYSLKNMIGDNFT